jgi:hypothetical protein
VWGRWVLLSSFRYAIPAANVQDAAHAFASWFSTALEKVSTFDWVLLGGALAIVYFLMMCFKVMTGTVPVEVELLESDTAATPVHALTAALREKLAKTGVSAPVVPAGAPRAGLIEALAASPIPQAGWIGKIMEALPIPEPPGYKLSGTLDGPAADTHIHFWLWSTAGGRSLLQSLPELTALSTDDDAIASTAFEVYSFISVAAVHAFPTWARWHYADAVEDFATGSRAASREDFAKACSQLSRASWREPDNALARLQVANLYERLAYPSGGSRGSKAQLEDTARKRAEALRRYLSIVQEWPWLVQARYRASVLAGALLGSCRGDSAAAEASRAGALRGLGLKREGDLVAVLGAIAATEADFALQLLKPWYMLVRWRRVRSQFEPSAAERRELKRAISISRHSRRVRALVAPKRPPAGSGWRFGPFWSWMRVKVCNRLTIAYGEVAVRVAHLSMGLTALDWQTEYVAACFESLLVRHSAARFPEAEEELGQPQKRKNWPPKEFTPSLLKRRRLWWLKYLRRNAFRHLDSAIAGAGSALPAPWVRAEDPDLDALRARGRTRRHAASPRSGALAAAASLPPPAMAETALASLRLGGPVHSGRDPCPCSHLIEPACRGRCRGGSRLSVPYGSGPARTAAERDSRRSSPTDPA